MMTRLTMAMTHGITYGGSARRPCTDTIFRMHPICHSDGSFHGDVLPFLGGFVEWRNGPVVWFARKSKTPPQSSCQVELVGVNMDKRSM